MPRSDVVVAVEANPALCRLMRERFKAEVQSSKLVVENCVVVDRAETSVIDFYIHKRNHRLSQLPRPAPGSLVLFEKVLLPVKTVAELIHCYGSPYYVKIDLEYCDARILRALFGLGVSPPFISAEAHSVEVFALLVALGGYNAFKLVDGYSVLGTYSRRLIGDDAERVNSRVSFPFHSAGPFGNDLDGPWMTADHFLRLLALEGLGWKDIHATNLEAADPSARITLCDFILRYAHRQIKTKFARVRGMMCAALTRIKS